MKELEYPFDCSYIIRKRRMIKRQLLKEYQEKNLIKKKIAILGGSTTDLIKDCLEIFLINYGILPEFFETGYNQYWESAMFLCKDLMDFKPDIIYIHTSNRNITQWPEIGDEKAVVDKKLEDIYSKFEMMWEKLFETYHCPIIQSNMELPFYRLLGNMDASDYHGRVNFIGRINEMMYEYANKHKEFYINDINYLSASYGIDKWLDQSYWYMYKYSLCIPAIPVLSHNIAKIIKAVFGKNKKALVIDLDNTIWGGVIGDDGVENIEIGQETPQGQAYYEFQSYIKAHEKLGILLNVCSKNDESDAVLGLNHPDGALNVNDFISIKANWESKSKNVYQISEELNILPDSIVFIDDNAAEREEVTGQLCTVEAPQLTAVENYIREIDKNGYFEVVSLSQDDFQRNRMYKENISREQEKLTYESYDDYLRALQMSALIKPFEDIYISRIVQLINKTNKFNLTTKRHSQAEVEKIMSDDGYITLYGRLKDKFGDNGIVSIIIGNIRDKVCNIELWLMSCRVFKRNMELAMFDKLIFMCKHRGVRELKGYYYPTQKNDMVRNFYSELGFKKVTEAADGSLVWSYAIESNYRNKNNFIKMEEEA